MQGPDYAKFLIAFALVIGTMFLLSWAMRRLGLASVPLMPGTKRRLKIIEDLALGPRHRLVIVQRDDVQHLIVLGQDRQTVVESHIPAPPVAVVATASSQDSAA